MKKVVHFEVHFVILYSKTELLTFLFARFILEQKEQGQRIRKSFS